MSLIIRIDVDRPYGIKNIFFKILSRISSDIYLPKIEKLGFLQDLKSILKILNHNHIRSFVFFRKCTLPSTSVLKLIDNGKHLIGLHLENSRSFDTFNRELQNMENHLNRKITAFSKHGSGKYKYGYRHYAPYEEEKYIEWGNRVGMKIFFGNNENPSKEDCKIDGLHVFTSAFWLEPYWRNTETFTIKWLINETKKRDIVLLFHPDNLTSDKDLLDQLIFILKNIPIKVLH